MENKNNINNFIQNEWIQRIIVWLVTIVVSATLFYSIVMATINDVKEIKPKVSNQEITITEMKMDIKYIKEGIQDIKQSLKK